MRIEEMKTWKYYLGMTSEAISSASGVPLSTVQKIFSGVTKSPRKSTLDALTAVLQAEADKKGICMNDIRFSDLPVRKTPSGHRPDPASVPGTLYRLPAGPQAAVLGEAMPAYQPAQSSSAAAGSLTPAQRDRLQDPRQGSYTVEDYYAIPDERRVELIDGVIYDMAAPSKLHQRILGDLHILFRECMDRHDGDCEVYLSPCDVRLDMDDRTMVQPDLLIKCGDDDIHARAFEGAPDLTLEILSPSTRSKDMLLKLHKYANAGVREYWIVDPERQTVLVYDLEHEEYYPEKYSFSDTIPIRISGGECSIDFSRIFRRIEKFY